MSRALLILANDRVRERARHWISVALPGTRVEFREPKRTLEQNAKLWAMLTDVAKQKKHCGRRYPADVWKCIFLHALGREVRFIPSLDGAGALPLGLSSSDLSKAEMSDLIALIQAWGDEHGVAWSDTQ
jgi:hypothetical protein